MSVFMLPILVGSMVMVMTMFIITSMSVIMIVV
jgi:hypothetical protein